jgi:hypothetical protein
VTPSENGLSEWGKNLSHTLHEIRRNLGEEKLADSLFNESKSRLAESDSARKALARHSSVLFCASFQLSLACYLLGFKKEKWLCHEKRWVCGRPFVRPFDGLGGCDTICLPIPGDWEAM